MSTFRVTRAGRARPQGSGWELAIWYLMRLTGIGLFVLALAHYIVVHFIFDPSEQTAEWVINERWSSVALRTIDWLMLVFVLFHAFMGVRTVIGDYTTGRTRFVLTMLLYLAGLLLLAMGSMVVFTVPVVGGEA
jgi:succinate dehydrogenase / fumarate reductase, membrane anchor subunit